MVDYCTKMIPLDNAGCQDDWMKDRQPEIEAVLDVTMAELRPAIKEMEPEERRLYCADMEATYSNLYGQNTGRFFNGFASASRPREPGRELGERIMAKRNPHYRNKKM